MKDYISNSIYRVKRKWFQKEDVNAKKNEIHEDEVWN